MSKPIKIEMDEWTYKGCIIIKQSHPALPRYVVFKNTKKQEIIGHCYYFKEAKILCKKNEVKNPYLTF